MRAVIAYSVHCTGSYRSNLFAVPLRLTQHVALPNRTPATIYWNENKNKQTNKKTSRYFTCVLCPPRIFERTECVVLVRGEFYAILSSSSCIAKWFRQQILITHSFICSLVHEHRTCPLRVCMRVCEWCLSANKWTSKTSTPAQINVSATICSDLWASNVSSNSNEICNKNTPLWRRHRSHRLCRR